MSDPTNDPLDVVQVATYLPSYETNKIQQHLGTTSRRIRACSRSRFGMYALFDPEDGVQQIWFQPAGCPPVLVREQRFAGVPEDEAQADIFLCRRLAEAIIEHRERLAAGIAELAAGRPVERLCQVWAPKGTDRQKVAQCLHQALLDQGLDIVDTGGYDVFRVARRFDELFSAGALGNDRLYRELDGALRAVSSNDEPFRFEVGMLAHRIGCLPEAADAVPA